MPFRALSFAAIIIFAAISTSSHAQDRSARAAPLPTVRTPAVIDCPERVEYSPAAKARVDAGEVPGAEASYFPAGLSNGLGLCIVRVLEDGTLQKHYSELSKIQNLPIRVDFHESHISVFAGQRHQDLVSNEPDLKCVGPVAADKTLTCGILVEKGFVIIDETGERTSRRVAVDPEEIFQKVVRGPNRLDFVQSGGLDSPGLLPRSPSCEAGVSDNLAWSMSIATARSETSPIDPDSRTYFTGANPPQFWGAYALDADVEQLLKFSVDGKIADDVLKTLMLGSKAELSLSMECGDDLTAVLSPQRVRALNAIYGALRQRMLM